ncbi:MAG: hypothetical protein HQL19_07265 [Candidatus Omnitrophica bacterium]|nr:hypothetical protein [Candidatus Omnitrophota bacterium]
MALYVLAAAFLLLFLYWAYLFVNTKAVLIYDAVDYVNFGRMLAEKGWIEFFRTAPHREPLFSIYISWAMKLEGVFGVPYWYLVKAINMAHLALAMALVFWLTRLLGAGRIVAGWAAFYTGLSPALLNSTLWLWSEGVALPWPLLCVIAAVYIWRECVSCNGRLSRVAGWSAVFTGAFLILIMVKIIAAAVLSIFLGLFFIFCCTSFVRKDGKRAMRALLAVILPAVVITGVLQLYKELNGHYSGHYVLTDRGAWALCGNTTRRLQPLTQERFAQALLSVPRLGLCEQVYGGRACAFWGFAMSDQYALQAGAEAAARGYSLEQEDRFYLSRSLELMRQHPFQEALLTAVESLKMLCWENRLFFVQYPRTPAQIFSTGWVVFGLCGIWALLSLAGFCCGLVKVFHGQQGLWDEGSSSAPVARLFTLVFLVGFIGLYAIFFIDIRYGLPSAPLFIALVFSMFY